jgi:SAM-dependent methyltransferase
MIRLYDSTIKVIHSVSDFVKPEVRPSTLFVKDRFGHYGDSWNGLSVVEIGVDLGFNALSMLNNLNIRKLYLIDPYISYMDGNYIFDKNSDHFRKARERLKNFEDKTVFICKYSDDAFLDVPDGLDFVYIDGNHGEDFVGRDIRNYYGKLRVGGVLGGHDFVVDYLGVCKAVLRFSFENDLPVFGRNMDWWMIKK